MKDYYGDYANENANPKLDFENSITMIENRNSGNEDSLVFEHWQSGVVILYLKTVKDAYVHVKDNKSGVVLASLSWPVQQTSTKDLRTMIPISKNQEIRCWGTWCDVYLIPYK